MKFKALNLLAYSSTAVAFFAFGANMAQAQVETMNATLATSSAIDTVVVDPMDFGEFLVQFAAGTPALVLNDAAVPAPTITGLGTNTIVQITPPATNGLITIETPAPAVMDMTRSAVVNFADANISLGTITYSTASQVSATVPVSPVTVPVTVLAAATPEDVRFGGTINITGTPADNPAHTASFTVTFTY